MSACENGAKSSCEGLLGHNVVKVLHANGTISVGVGSIDHFLQLLLKELQKEVNDLKTFKTMSTTVWVVVQIIFGIVATAFGLYLKSS